MECFCELRNIQDKLEDRNSQCDRRCGTPLDGPVMPLGAHLNPIFRKTEVVSINLEHGYCQESS